VEGFLSNYWQKQSFFCRGPADRFSALLSWTELNQILAHHWRETFRFRLALQGRDLDPPSYADLEGSTPRIRSKDVTDHLRRGATLSFNAIDELHEPLTRLAEFFEAFFRGGTKINIYAAWRALHGLDLHRDDEEIFILQLDGRKRWQLYGFSVDGVDRSRLASASVPPPGADLDTMLQPGDLLYIPKGCYHVAVPMSEPTLHLTVSIRNPCGEKFAETGSNFKPRASFSLPWSATPELLPPGREFLVRMHAHAGITTVGSNAGLELRCGGRAWRFPQGMQCVIEMLNDGSAVPISRLIEGVAGRLDEEMVCMLIGMLVRENLVAITM
jgi:ribosomal protein L16 Arg81 hydroxylase